MSAPSTFEIFDFQTESERSFDSFDLFDSFD